MYPRKCSVDQLFFIQKNLNCIMYKQFALFVESPASHIEEMFVGPYYTHLHRNIFIAYTSRQMRLSSSMMRTSSIAMLKAWLGLSS